MPATPVPRTSVASLNNGRDSLDTGISLLSPRLGLKREGSIKRKLQRQILVVAPTPNHGFLQGIARYSRENNWTLNTELLHTGKIPKGIDFDGIIANLAYPSAIADYLANKGIPCVTVASTREFAPSPSVGPDDLSVGKLAAQHLASRGCHELIWAPACDDAQNRDRQKGFLAEATRLGIPCRSLPPAQFRMDGASLDNFEEWETSLFQRLSSLPERTGVFAFSDRLAAAISRTAETIKEIRPLDLAILGAGNELIDCESNPVPISSIDLNTEEMSFQAARYLERIMDGSEVTEQTISVAPKGVVARESTEAPSTDIPRINQAIRFIARNYMDANLSVSTVADALEISRRQLERDFRTARGCTVREHIENTRVKEASQLLRQRQDANVAEIARMVGISAPGNFFRIFRKHFGVTPAAYKNRRLRK